MKLPSIAFALLLAASLLPACGDAKTSDITIVRAYFVVCDSVAEVNHCRGPSHRAGSETFTVIISTNEVKRSYDTKTFHGCEVTAPRRWKCLDAKDDPAIMYDDVLIWDERKGQAVVTKGAYCLADALKGKKSDTSDKLACYLGDS